RSRRIRAQSKRRRKLASLGALASAALLAVFAYGVVSDVSHNPNGRQRARAAEGVQAGGRASVPSLGPLVNTVPIASVTDAPPNLAATPASPLTGPVPPAQAPFRSSRDGGMSGTPASSASSASAPAPVPASAPAPAPTTTTPPPPPPTQPSCTIGQPGT